MDDTKKSDNRGHFKRMKDKYLASGLAAFHDYEIVELLLILGTPRSDKKHQAKEALKKFGSLGGVLEASPDKLEEIDGLGPRNTFGIRLIRDMLELYMKSRIREKPLAGSPTAVFEYLRQAFFGLKKEVFKVIYLDGRNRIVEAEELFRGTIDQSAIYPRELIAAALKNDAGRLILAHNHPGGSLRPSPDDIKITRRLRDACRAVDIEILYHVIVAGDRYFSFREHGLI